MKLTFDDVFNGNCIVYWKSNIHDMPLSFIPGGDHISLTRALHSTLIKIEKIEIKNWKPIAQFLQQEKLIKIENGKVTLLF